MKKIILSIVAVMSMTAAMAQEANDQKAQEEQRPRLEMRVNRMANQLKLTDEQKAQVLDLYKDFEAKMQTILTKEQYEEYQKSQNRPRFRGGRPGGPRPGFGGPQGGFGGPQGGFGGQQPSE
jgi:Ni/Co efflux regulator RcnB